MTVLLSALPVRLRTSACLVGIATFLAIEPRLGAPLEWFAAAYLLKLLAGYGLPEIPGQTGPAAGSKSAPRGLANAEGHE